MKKMCVFSRCSAGIAKWLFVVSLAFCLLSRSSVASAEMPIRIQGETMGTYYVITIDAASEDSSPSEIQHRIDQLLKEFNRQMSTWHPESEISRFNRSDSIDWFPVSRDFAEVVTESLRIHQLTSGSFDPTVGPLIDLWGFGAEKHRQIPDGDAVRQALQLVGLHQLQVRTDPPALKKTRPEIQINLSAIAPGFAIDLVAETLQEMGFTSWLVDIGGESRAGQRKSSGQPWKIGVESPHGGIYKIVELVDRCVATSGDYRNFFEMEGRRFSHAMNPKTGWPVENPPASVSVLSTSSMTADALGTALMVMGSTRGIQFAEEHDLDVMFLDVAADGAVVETSRGVFAAIPVHQSPKGSDGEEGGSADGLAAELASPASDDSNQTAQNAWWLPFAAAAGIFLLAMTGMSIGVLVRNKELKGSCGGLASMPGNDGRSICELCTQPREDCINPEIRERMKTAADDAG